MSSSFNQTTLLGNLGREPEFNITPTGTPICKCSIAVNEKWGDKEKTMWVEIVFWSKLAEVAEKYLKKGSQILVSGRLCCDSFKDKEGNERKKWYVTADKMQMLGEKRESKPSDATSFDPFEELGF